jgi:redox-sensitive bicupin YhaK (pirin superfamily)
LFLQQAAREQLMHYGRRMPSFMLIAGRPRDLGGFSVRRALPSVQHRLVGPFIFWDHLGPTQFDPGGAIDVRPHPHINLATVTYLFEGEIVHKDSLGSDLAIAAGDVNWMTAGRGIVHSERTGSERRKSGGAMHGIQSWVALPTEAEEMEPAFQHVDRKRLPEVEQKGARLRVIAGTAFGATAPTAVLSPTFYVDARLDAGAEVALPDEYAERAVYVVDGAVEVGGQTVGPATMAVAEGGGGAAIRALVPSRVMLLGGAPVGKRYIWWNFVSSTEERIERAKREWKERAFPTVPGDDAEFIPLPE